MSIGAALLGTPPIGTCTTINVGAVQQRDAADEAHGGSKDSKVVYLHLKSASQLIASVGRTLEPFAVDGEMAAGVLPAVDTRKRSR